MKAARTLLAGLILAGFAPGQEFSFKTDVRLVEVYATVLDHKGKYIAGLTREQFRVTDNGEPQPIASFETSASGLSCAILLDTTGSMGHAMPVVQNAIVRLIDRLRDNDSTAVYGFSTRLITLQEFTTKKTDAKRAVLRARPSGTTALFDALSQLARLVARRNAKKVIVVFTDGQDNASVLNATAAITAAKKAGVPIYAVAQGEALQNPALIRQLKETAQATGGLAYSVRQAQDVDDVFQAISKELEHTYLVAYKPPPTTDRKWRTVRLEVAGGTNYRIRAREGYLPE